MKKTSFYILLVVVTCTHSFAKERSKGSIYFSDRNQTEYCKGLLITNDSLGYIRSLSHCIATFHAMGFLQARIDSIHFDSLQPMAYGVIGEMYHWASIKTDSITNEWLNMARINTRRLLQKPVQPHIVTRRAHQLLVYMENHGYPFAMVKYYDFSSQSSTVSLNMTVNPGPEITLDTLYIKGDARISQAFIQSYLGFDKGAYYNHKKVSDFDNRLRQLSYLSIIRPSEVEFIPGRARVYTYITNRRASQFSGLVGFASGDENSSRIKFTGDVNLRLVNSFKQGEENILRWQALGEGTQRLNISSSWPYIMGSRVGVRGGFALFRLDTTFININPKISVDFFFHNGSNIGMGVDYRSSSTVASQAGERYGNHSTTLYQLGYVFGRNASHVFPIKDFFLELSAGVGKRTVDKTQLQTDKTKSTIGEINLSTNAYHPLIKQNIVLHLGIQGQLLGEISNDENKGSFLENELYRIGGINNLRGFNQESIITRAYSIATAELQLRLQNTLNLYLFFDKALIEQGQTPYASYSWPFGAGIGFQLATEGGILNLSYAVGGGMGQEANLRDAKVHVGYMASF